MKLTKEQLRQIRAKAEVEPTSRVRKPPPAPAMPTLETESESEVSAPAPPAKRQGERCLDRKAGTCCKAETFSRYVTRLLELLDIEYHQNLQDFFL